MSKHSKFEVQGFKVTFQFLRRTSGFAPVGSRYFISAMLSLLVMLSFGCGSEQSDNAKVQERLSTTELQQFTSGKKLYQQRCQNCHMEDGSGLGTLIPPLKNSDYLFNNISGVVRGIKYGLKGPILVNGVKYNQPMPANPNLTNVEILELMTYITNAWDNPGTDLSLKKIESVFD